MNDRIAGYVNANGERVIYSSALSDEAGKAYTLLCVGEDLFDYDDQGRVKVGPDGQTPLPKSEFAAQFMVAYYTIYKRPWGNDRETRATWVDDYKRGVEELRELGIVEEPKFDVLGQPATNQFGFPVVGRFKRHLVDRGAVELKEGPSS